MGTYISQTDLQNKLGVTKLTELADPEGTGSPVTSIIDDAIAGAEGRMESYLRTRYTLPVPATPLVQQLCVDLACFALYQNASAVKDGVYDVRKDAYDEAIKTLTAISKGTAALDVPAVQETATSPVAANPPVGASTVKRPLFTDEKLRSY